jgi:hypothetical protein
MYSSMGPIGGLVIFWIVVSLIIATFGSEKKIGYWGVFWWSVLLSPIVGIIVAMLSPSIIEKNIEQHKWKGFVEKGKKAEYKEQYKEAIDFYMDALYHLENDYGGLNNKLDNSRLGLVATYKSKVEELKSKL